jgi:HTH-type transcriptional regulator / antitoxin HipB
MTDNPWYRARTLDSLGSALADLRDLRGLTQTDLAEKVGTSRPTISRIERGEAASDETILKAMAAMGYELVAVPRGHIVRIETTP